MHYVSLMTGSLWVIIYDPIKVRERTAEEIVADIEHAARTPVPDDDILSDASGSISDGDVLSDGDSDADIDTAEEWELQQARIRSEAMHTIKERFQRELNQVLVDDYPSEIVFETFQRRKKLTFPVSVQKNDSLRKLSSKESPVTPQKLPCNWWMNK